MTIKINAMGVGAPTGSADQLTASNVQANNASFTGSVHFAVATAAFSSNNAVALLTSNHMYFTVEGTVARIYFNQTGTAVYRATINLATF